MGPVSGRRIFVVLVAATLVSYPLGLGLGQPFLLPLLNSAPAYLVMVRLLRAGDRGGAVFGMLVWAAAAALFGTLAFRLWPTPPDALVLNGPAYRDEMVSWIRTGVGAEGSPRLFLPQHLLHLAAFVALSLLTASAASILMGAVFMNFMAFYVASLDRLGAPGWAVVLLGWQPWAICRVAAFCVLGAVLAEPLLFRLRPYPRRGSARPYLLWAGGGILADWLLKAALAPGWGLWLRRLLP
jgi:energy-converting hydrogenase Eha subunit E